MNNNYSRIEEFWMGVKATIPLVVGAVPFGIIFGALAVTSGMTAAGASTMSAIVFAGASQFIAVGLVASGASNVVIIMTTFVVNIRHALYSVTLSPHMKHLPHKWLLPLGFWLTDESFVVVSKRYNEEDRSKHKHWFFLGSAIFMYSNWQLSTYIGVIAGQNIPDAASWGLDFAMVVTFIGMLVPLVQGNPTLIAVIVAGVTAVLAYGLPNKLGLLVAALLGIAAGMLAERRLANREGEINADE